MVNTDQLDEVLYRVLGEKYAGAWAIDQLPTVDRDPFFVIINTDPSFAPGEHWLGICFVGWKAIFVDPMALPLHKLNPIIRSYISRASVIETMPHAVQGWFNGSERCGEFCAYILTNLGNFAYNLGDLVRSCFSDVDFNLNDQIASTFWSAIKGGQRTARR